MRGRGEGDKGEYVLTNMVGNKVLMNLHQQNFFGARVCIVTFKQTFENTPNRLPNNRIVQGKGGSPYF